MAYRSSRSDVSERDYAPRRAPVRDYEDDISVDIRERERVDRTPAFLREDVRRTDAGPLVLRSREVETVDRRRPRSPSPQVRYRERFIERERERAPVRVVERSPSPPPARVQVVERVERRQRERSPTPDRDLIRLRIERERQRERTPSPSPSPSPPPQPQVIRGPTIEREVITHYRDIDHGIIRAKPPTPPPPPRRAPSRGPQQRETDIDIDIGRHETDIDIRQRTRSQSRPRSPSRPRERPRPLTRPSYDDDDLIIVRKSEKLAVGDAPRRRAHSAAPRAEWDDEAEYITGKIDARGRMGEALHGATRDWTIVDVPPGTERVKMDGVGGGGAEVTWQRYNGVRRSKFIPDRDDSPVSAIEPLEPGPETSRDRLSVQIYDSKHRDREVEVEEVRDRRISIRGGERHSGRKREGMWTEITKDLVTREAIERLGYEYEETEFFFYVMKYLQYEDVLQLIDVSKQIRRSRRRRAREYEEHDHYVSTRRHQSHHRHAPWDTIDDERVVEREVIYDSSPRFYR